MEPVKEDVIDDEAVGMSLISPSNNDAEEATKEDNSGFGIPGIESRASMTAIVKQSQEPKEEIMSV